MPEQSFGISYIDILIIKENTVINPQTNLSGSETWIETDPMAWASSFYNEKCCFALMKRCDDGRTIVIALAPRMEELAQKMEEVLLRKREGVFLYEKRLDASIIIRRKREEDRPGETRYNYSSLY